MAIDMTAGALSAGATIAAERKLSAGCPVTRAELSRRRPR